MDAVKFIKTYNRMCNSYKGGRAEAECEKCPLNKIGCGLPAMEGHEVEAVHAVEEWAKNAPYERTFNGVRFSISRPSYFGGIPESRQHDWSIYECDEDRNSHLLIAKLRWDQKEPGYDLESLGMRLAESGSTELLKWILEFAEEAEREIEDEYDY